MVNRNHFNYFLTILILGVSLNFNHAQVQDSTKNESKNTTGLPTDEVTVLKDFQARLVESQRIKILPNLPEFQTAPLTYNYDVNVRALALDYPALVIKPIAMIPDDKMESFHSSIKLGYGYPRFSLAEIDASRKLNDNLEVGLAYDHIAARHNEKIPSRFNRHDGEIYANYTLSPQAQIGVAFVTSYDSRDIIRNNFVIDSSRSVLVNGVKISLDKPTDKSSNIDYSLDFIPYRLNINDLSIRENGTTLKAKVAYSFGIIKSKLDLQFDRVAVNMENVDNLSSMQIVPQVAYKSDYWNADAGVRVIFENGENYLLPEVEVLREIINTKLYIGLFANSDVQANSYKNRLQFNPYLHIIDSIRNQKDLRFGLTAKGQSDKWEYNLQGGYKTMKDVLDYKLIENLEGDDLLLWNATQVNGNTPFVELAGAYQLTPSIKMNLNTMYQNLKDTEGNAISGYYTFRMGVGSEIKLLSNKLSFMPGLDMFTGIQSSDNIRNSNFYDLHLDINYQLFKKISLFINADNLLNNTNERWLGYSALGIAINGGAKFKF